MLKIGSRVKYMSRHWGDENNNPAWDGIYGRVGGTIVGYGSLGWQVKWDNGEGNGYRVGDLEEIRSGRVARRYRCLS